MRLKEKKILQKFAATLKKFSAQGAKKVDYGIGTLDGFEHILYVNNGLISEKFQYFFFFVS